jgi:hypothetical protein
MAACLHAPMQRKPEVCVSGGTFSAQVKSAMQRGLGHPIGSGPAGTLKNPGDCDGGRFVWRQECR